jgi:hypothetical protein
VSYRSKHNPFETRTMSGLGLVPNEVVGYRLKPDWYSWNVVLVKRHGPQSKQAGAEYDTTLAHCKTLAFAVRSMLDHAVRHHAARAQREVEAATGSIADAQSVLNAVELAKADVMVAIARLQAELDQAGLKNKHVIQTLGAPADAAEL